MKVTVDSLQKIYCCDQQFFCFHICDGLLLRVKMTENVLSAKALKCNEAQWYTNELHLQNPLFKKLKIDSKLAY